MHEFVNSRAAGVVPVTHVPAGSGNAFAKYQTVLAGQACQDEEAIYLAVKNRTRKLNLAVILSYNKGIPALKDKRTYFLIFVFLMVFHG